MPGTEFDPPESAHHDYHEHDKSLFDNSPSGLCHVVVPPEPPVFTPAAARALLRLLFAVRAKRAERVNPSLKENGEP
jgi:hypothetical protein